MVNPSAARHLTLVVGVLLCFFVYMGYVVKNRQTEAADDTGTAIMAAGGGQAESRGDASGLPLMTMSDGADKTPSERLTPIGIPSLPAPIGVDLRDPGEGSSSSRGELNLAEGLFSVGGMSDTGSLRPPPAGSIEETAKSPTEAITGLIPDALPLEGTTALLPSGGVAPAPGGVSLPPPPGSPSIAETFAPVEQPPVAALRPEAERQSAASESRPNPRLDPIRSEPEPPLRLRPAGQENTASQPSSPQSRFPVPATVPPPAPAFGGGASDALRIYVIRPGDTLSRIAVRELGSMALADNIYLLNRDVISNPDHLLVGTRIKLPPRETVAAAASATVAPPLAPTATHQPGVRPVAAYAPDEASGGRVYRIAPGDTLSSIALRFYGSSAGWRFLHESNRAAIPDPNRLTVGAEISIPPYESQ